jgi:hypothetical protein
LPFSNEKLLLLLFNTCCLETPHLQSNGRRSFFYSKQTSGTTYKATSITKNNAPIKRKLLKSVLKDRLDSMVTQQRKNVEEKTKVEAIERLLSNNKRLRVSYVLIRK